MGAQPAQHDHAPAATAGLAEQSSGRAIRGLRDVIATDSEICQLDHGHKKLLYRGYDLVELVESCCFEAVTYLLLFGEIPTAAKPNWQTVDGPRTGLSALSRPCRRRRRR